MLHQSLSVSSTGSREGFCVQLDASPVRSGTAQASGARPVSPIGGTPATPQNKGAPPRNVGKGGGIRRNYAGLTTGELTLAADLNVME